MVRSIRLSHLSMFDAWDSMGMPPAVLLTLLAITSIFPRLILFSKESAIVGQALTIEVSLCLPRAGVTSIPLCPGEHCSKRSQWKLPAAGKKGIFLQNTLRALELRVSYIFSMTAVRLPPKK